MLSFAPVRKQSALSQVFGLGADWIATPPVRRVRTAPKRACTFNDWDGVSYGAFCWSLGAWGEFHACIKLMIPSRGKSIVDGACY